MSVILFKEDDISYRQAFLDVGIKSVEFVPVLTLTRSDFSEILEELGHYSAREFVFIVTSKQSAHVLRDLLVSGGIVASKVFAVGESTANVLSDLNIQIITSPLGTADNLANIIISDLDAGSDDLVFLCGDKSLNTIPEKLEAAGRRFRRIQCYKNSPVSSSVIISRLKSILPSLEEKPFLGFFSPSGVNAVLKEPSVAACFDFPLTVLSIGKTTEDSLKGVSGISVRTCALPNAKCMASLVNG